jgi:Raf kinase inhibitor-like YbhB/YbcL family protein
MQISSPVFNEQGFVPTPYTCKGTNINPPLEFRDVPTNAKSLVLLIEDVDAPEKPWVHWLVFNIPATVTELPENGIPDGAVQGLCNGGTFGYEGPCPRYFAGTHHYQFRLIALDQMLDLPAESDKDAVLQATQGHIVGEAWLVGLAEGERAAV